MPRESRGEKYDEVVANVSKTLNLSEAQAENFISVIEKFMDGVQDNFTKIASHETSKERKRQLRKETVEGYFDSWDAEVQVSSLRIEAVESLSVGKYLARLAELSETTYNTVELYFDRNYLSIGEFDKVGSGRYEFIVNAWQMFKGCSKPDTRLPSGKRCYKDYTRKGFHLAFVKEDHSWRMAIKLVTAEQAVPLYNPEYEVNWENIK
jgi:hypothetical protein